MEDLNIAGMKKILGKSASDAGLSTLVAQIKINAIGMAKHSIK
jgi:hypothetical protein